MAALGNVQQAQPGHLDGRLPRKVDPVEMNRPEIGHQRLIGAQGRGLARAVRPEQSDTRRRTADLEADSADRVGWSP